MGSDRMIPRHVCDKAFNIRFPDRSEWKVFLPDRTEGLIWYTDDWFQEKKRHWNMEES
jgi:hypothetical protein